MCSKFKVRRLKLLKRIKNILGCFSRQVLIEENKFTLFLSCILFANKLTFGVSKFLSVDTLLKTEIVIMNNFRGFINKKKTNKFTLNVEVKENYFNG